MRCEAVQRLLSDRLDDPLAPATEAAVRDHVADCGACASFEHRLQRWRRQLRVVALEPPPDVAGAVRSRLEAEDPPRHRTGGRVWWPRAAAVFVVAFSLGAAVVGLGGPQRLAATELDQLVRSGQHEVRALQATVAVTELGWHPEVPVRRYRGTMTYRAPESLLLGLEDQTTYPDDRWRGNDVTVVVDEEVAWTRARVGCPGAALPDCLPPAPQTTLVTGREPFDPAESVPLDLVVPVDSFGTADTPGEPTEARVAGRDAIQTTVTVAQLRPFLDGLLGVGTWRRLFATDRATVALDARYGIPLRVEVTAAPGVERDRWAAMHGYDDTAGGVIWSWELSDVRVNVEGADGPPAPPANPDRRLDRGFETADVDLDGLAAPVADPPGDLTLHRVGRVGQVQVASWSDGRAWVRVRVHPGWDQPRLFGRTGGDLVRRISLDDGTVAYVVEGGGAILIHADDHDVAITGSVTSQTLRQVAEQLDVGGRPVPRHWTEAAGGTLAQARETLPGLLAPPAVATFTGPAVRIDGETVTLSYSGNGDRGLVLTQAPGDVLGPPLDAVVLGVTVRDRPGRYTPRTGTLEWVEDGRTVSLRSTSLTRTELLAIASRLEPRP